jgi:HlyD family secretion protein
MTTSVQQPRRRISPWWALLLVPVVAGALTLTGTIKLPSGSSSTASTTKVETATATQGTFRVSVTGPGTLVAVNSADVKPQVNGTILSIVKVGDRVTKGQLLAKLDPTTYQRALDNAQLTLSKAQAQLAGQRATASSDQASQGQQTASAQATYDNALLSVQTATTSLQSQKNLFAAGGASAQNVKDAQTALEQAQTNLESARVALQTARQSLPLKNVSSAQNLQNLQYAVDQAAISLKSAQTDLLNTKVYAPFNGVVSAVNGAVGGSALGTGSSSGGGALLTLLDDSKVEMPVQVDETEIAQVKIGQRADVTLDALPGQTFVGKVTRISPSATIQSNIAVFYATVTLDNAARALRPGMTSEAEIISQEIQNAVTIPKRAVQTVNTRSYVDVQLPVGQKTDDGKTVDTRRVKTGADDGTNIVITDGLKAGETVVLPTRQQKGASTSQIGGP